MPCFCWVSDSYLEPEMSEIREHVKEVVRLVKTLHGKGDFYPESGSIPRNLLADVHKLLDDLYNGKCQEGKKK